MAKLISDNLDCPVHAYTKAEVALRELAERSPGVIVTDYFMPQMDGLEFIQEASKVAPEATFIMISGHDLEPVRENLAYLGKLKACLQKPLGSRPLVEAILMAWPGEDAPAARR
jgi:DNA-binding NarL/FixJ family response regulator